MKPNFALDFRNDAITLLHRTPRGWHVVGTVALDAPDLAADLAVLRTTALELSPLGMTTKLVIPNAQILFTQAEATAPDAARRRKQVARALEGVTPYAVADLAFDICGTGPVVEVAVIAKETLAEAEAFATEHRFNPVSFVAVAETPGFTTEAWFGPTGCAPAHLSEGQRVERDNAPVVIPGRESPVAPAVAADPAPDRAEQTATGALADARTGPDAADIAFVAPGEGAAQADMFAEIPGDATAFEDPAPVAPPADLSPADLMPQDAPEPDSFAAAPSPDAPEPDAPRPDFPEPDSLPDPHRHPGPAADLEPEEVLARIFASEAAADHPATPYGDAPAAMAQTATDMPPAPVNANIPAPVPTPDDEAPMALDVVDDLPEDRAGAALPPAAASVLDPSIPDDVPPPPAASIMVAFGSRRALEASAKEAAARAGTSKPVAARPGMAKAPGLGGISATRTGPQAKVTTLPPRPAQTSVVRLPPRAPVAGSAASDATSDGARATAKPVAKTSAASKALRGLGALVTSPGIAGGKERKPAPIVTPPTGPSSAASAAAATLTKAGAKPYSGGLGNRSMERAKPRYLGLILTGILLVFLVLVAAWSTLFLESRDTTTADPNAVVDAATAAPQTAAVVDGDAVDPEMLSDLQGPAQADAAPAPDAATAAAPLPDTDAEADAIAAAVAGASPETASEPAPATALDTEAAEAVPLLATPQDEFLLATMDEPPSMPDALSLPQPVARNDAPPGQAVPPPPFGTVYRFDAAGLIVPTPEGILTPEGVLLFAGRPALEPPQRPASLAPQPAALPADAAPTSGAVTAADAPAVTAPVADAPVFADPALAGARPRSRPAGLTPPTQNVDDDASLAPQADSRFASLRPRAKPAALAAAAETPAEPTADPIADLGAQAASLTAQANATASANPLILAVSRKPAPRPQDMSRAVEEAVAVASRQPDPTPPPTPPVTEAVARSEPEADDEPEVTKAMPRLPTSTSVAKQATYVNAINLSKVNLIGIYGSSSNRYALIRQSNGRYKKVEVGDSFDGGRVAAITTSEVRYQKSGKIVTLALPKG